MRTQASVTVPYPADQVFGYLERVANETQWRQSIVGSRYVGTELPAVGVDGETDVAMGPKSLTMRWTIHEFTPGQHVAWTLDGEPWNGGGSYTVRPTEGGTEVVARLQVKLKGVARLLEPIVGLQFAKGLRTDLRQFQLALAASLGD